MSRKLKGPTATLRDSFEVAGKLMDIASRADILMCNTLRILVGVRMPLARAIFYTLDAMPPRQNLLRRTAKTLEDKTVSALVERVSDACDIVYKQRRQIAHSLMMIRLATEDGDPEDGKAILHNPKTGHEQKVTTKYLNGLLRAAMGAVNLARDEYFALCDHLQLPRELFLQRDDVD